MTKAGGGIVNKTYTTDAYTLVDGSSDISSKILGDCYSVDYIADAVLEDKLPVKILSFYQIFFFILYNLFFFIFFEFF